MIVQSTTGISCGLVDCQMVSTWLLLKEPRYVFPLEILEFSDGVSSDDKTMLPCFPGSSLK